VSFNYGGQTFNANVPFESKLKLDHYDLAVYYPIPLLKTATAGKLNVELGLNARKIDFEGTVDQPSTGVSASKDLTLYVPMVYVGVQIKPISAFSIEAEVRGISYSDNSYYDYIGRVKIKPIPLFYIAGGYRAETLEIDEEDVNVDLDFKGPFIEAGLSF
jgi:outer membrane protein